MLPVGYLPCTQDPPNGANMGRVLEEIFAEAQMAEESGWDGCFITEHHQQPDGYLPSPLLTAAMVGARTTRIKVGTCVLLLPLHHPIHVAEDCAIIDLATRGRLVLSVGAGYQPPDFDLFQANPAERVARLVEGVKLIRQAWRGERFSFEGKHYRLKDALVTPTPHQRPGPPIWMASWTEKGIARAERLADGWISDPVQSLPVIKGFVDQYRAAASAAGRKPFVCLMRDAVVADSMAEAEVESGPTMVTHRFYFEYGAFQPDEYLKDVKRPADLTFHKLAQDRLIVGSPDDCVEQLHRWKEIVRPDYLIIRFRQPGGPAHQRALEIIRKFGEKVIPRI
jgi:alkanesulfonate monooxygenase SsuD/methylene tetrahydromethanopterin reductase-like flavin-dependent oxidoreductase (luciferase family)